MKYWIPKKKMSPMSIEPSRNNEVSRSRCFQVRSTLW